MLTWPCRVVLSRFQSSQTESFGKIRPFDQYKEPKTLKTYFSTAKRVLAYFDRIAAGEDYFFSAESEEDSEAGGKEVDADAAAETVGSAFADAVAEDVDVELDRKESEEADCEACCKVRGVAMKEGSCRS